MRKTDSKRELHQEKVWLCIQQVQELVKQGKGITWIAPHMNISRATVYSDLHRKHKPDCQRSSILYPFLS
ncbi:helix-turn-helix domain-containing protein [Bacillus sp. S10(2024)]|uniref:helix-turn-helix domain-containing protein n=1 Tax=Bacillus sp. S10(2024) TaxID=3162886 RepID=UPI003D2030AD